MRLHRARQRVGTAPAAAASDAGRPTSYSWVAQVPLPKLTAVRRDVNEYLTYRFEKSYALVHANLQQRSGWSCPVSRKTWIARLGESTSLAAGSVLVQAPSGESTTCLVKKTARAVVTTYW